METEKHSLWRGGMADGDSDEAWLTETSRGGLQREREPRGRSRVETREPMRSNHWVGVSW
jgi:hypothetical protein